MDWELLFNLAFGFAYGHYGYRFFVTARRRVAFRSGHDLHWTLALIWALLWPLWTVLWITSAVVFQQRPASLLREPSAADRAARAMAQRREEQIQAAKDWEERAAFWYAEGQRAEAEDSQTLKWLVAKQLEFLLDTRPSGAETPEEKAKRQDEMRALDLAKANRKAKTEQTRSVKEWPSYGERLKSLEHRTELAKRVLDNPILTDAASTSRNMHIGSHHVDFCNLCHRYRDRKYMDLKGVCRECAHEQGI